MAIPLLLKVMITVLDRQVLIKPRKNSYGSCFSRLVFDSSDKAQPGPLPKSTPNQTESPFRE
jgi:hypothetical protein